MERLKKDWLTDGLIDAEYKRYVLLAYLKNVKKAFSQNELYPSLGELVFHYNNLLELKKNKALLSDNFPAEITGLDRKKLEIIYNELVKDDDVMKELSEIIEYSVPRFKKALDEGKEIYEFVESNCELSPVGLLPLYVDEGYFFVSATSQTETEIYRYQMTLIEHSQQNLRGIHARLIDRVRKGIGETYESLKRQLMNKFDDLPNPATFVIESKYQFPADPTLIPVAKRLLVRYISTA